MAGSVLARPWLEGWWALPGRPEEDEARIFVLWTRVDVTPSGGWWISSPGGGRRSGEPGWEGPLIPHFLERSCGDALQLIEDAASSRGGSSGGAELGHEPLLHEHDQRGTGVAREVPGTLRWHPADDLHEPGGPARDLRRRDLDFWGAYGLERRARRGQQKRPGRDTALRQLLRPLTPFLQ